MSRSKFKCRILDSQCIATETIDAVDTPRAAALLMLAMWGKGDELEYARVSVQVDDSAIHVFEITSKASLF